MNLVEMRLRNLSYLGAGCSGRFGERQKRADLLDAEAQRASAANKGQPSDMAFLIGAAPARRPRRRRHELDALVVAHSFEIDARRRRKLPQW